MANSLLTINMITREAIRLWKNSNAFLQNIQMQYDDSFAITGAKIGTALRIRLPNDYTVRTGATASPQDTSEVSTTMTLATQKGVDMSFSSVDRTMSLDDFSERVLAPAINNLGGAVAYDVMTGVEGGIANYASQLSGGVTTNPTDATYLLAGAMLRENSAPLENRAVINDPVTEARVVSALKGLFNPSPAISKQYMTGVMGEALGFTWFSDQTVLKHTNGSFVTGTVNGASQTGQSLVVNAITGTLNAGDLITIANVFGVNRITKQSTGRLRQFVVTANVSAGATTIPIYPAITPAVGGQAVQYQTVTASPANNATILPVGVPSETFRKNFVFSPQAVTMATADLVLPKNSVEEAAREQFDGVSLRMVSQYLASTDQFITRLDVLYGYLWVKPEWAVVVADAI